MHDYVLAHLSDAVLIRDLAALITQDRLTTASLLAHLAEVDARRLYLPAGYASMHAYCVGELHLSEDAASKRIQAARAARRFPVVFPAVAEGRLHLTAVCLLAPYLTEENAIELVGAATHRRKTEIEEMLALRFARPQGPDVGWGIRPIAPGSIGSGPNEVTKLQHALEHVDLASASPAGSIELAPGQVDGEPGAGSPEHAPAHVRSPLAEAAPPGSPCFLLQVTLGESTREKLRYAQALLSHAVPSGDLAQVLDRALDVLIERLERRKLGRTSKPQTPRPGGPLRRFRERSARAGCRYVPARVRRAVWERDQGQCTFVGRNGHRCEERRFLEFDHVDPVARGGVATVERMRLRCRAHNNYEAERAFGAEFMRRKRNERRMRVAEARAGTAAQAATQDVVSGLRALGCRCGEARRAAELSAAGAPLAERMRIALQSLGRSSMRSAVRVE